MSDLGTLLREHYERRMVEVDVAHLIDQLEAGQLDARLTPAAPPRRRLAWVAGVGIAVVLVAVFLVLRSLAGAPPVVDEPSSTVSSSTTLAEDGGDGISATVVGGGPRTYLPMPPAATFSESGIPTIAYVSEVVDSGSAEFALEVVRCADRDCAADPELRSVPIGTGFLEFRGVEFVEDRPIVLFGEVPDNGVGPPDFGLLVCGDSSCSAHDVVPLAGSNHRMIVPPDGRLVISFNDASGALIVLRCDDPACGSFTTNSVWPGSPEWVSAGLGLQADGNPYLYTTYRDLDIGALMLAYLRCLDPACAAVDTVTFPIGGGGPEGDVVLYSTAVVAPDDAPGFLFVDDEFQLMYVRCVDPDCSAIEPASRIGPRRRYSEGFDMSASDGIPMFVFAPEDAGFEGGDFGPGSRLVLARCDDPSCATGVAATVYEELPPFVMSLVFRPDGSAFIAATTWEGELVVVSCSDPSCTDGALDFETWDQSLTEEEPTGSDDPVFDGWSSVEIEGLPGRGGGGMSSGVVDESGRVVVVGSAYREEGLGGPPPGVVVVSDDLATWTVHDIADWGEMEGIVLGGPGFVAAGSTCGFESQDPDCAPAIWTSADAVTWDRVSTSDQFVPMSECPFDYCQMRVDALVAAGGVFLAAGVDGLGGTMWRSEDALAWERLGVPDVDVPEGSEFWVDRVVGLPGAGFLLQVGLGTPILDDAGEWIDYTFDFVLLRSNDGLTWEPIDPPVGDAYSTFLTDLVPWAGGVYVRLESCDESYECVAAAFASTDAGTSWIEVAPPPSFHGDGRLFAFGEGLLFAGEEIDESQGFNRGVFARSADLESWEVFTADPAVFPERVPFSDLLVLPDGSAVGIGAGEGFTGASGIYVWSPA